MSLRFFHNFNKDLELIYAKYSTSSENVPEFLLSACESSENRKLLSKNYSISGYGEWEVLPDYEDSSVTDSSLPINPSCSSSDENSGLLSYYKDEVSGDVYTTPVHSCGEESGYSNSDGWESDSSGPIRSYKPVKNKPRSCDKHNKTERHGLFVDATKHNVPSARNRFSDNNPLVSSPNPDFANTRKYSRKNKNFAKSSSENGLRIDLFNAKCSPKNDSVSHSNLLTAVHKFHNLFTNCFARSETSCNHLLEHSMISKALDNCYDEKNLGNLEVNRQEFCKESGKKRRLLKVKKSTTVQPSYVVEKLFVRPKGSPGNSFVEIASCQSFNTKTKIGDCQLQSSPFKCVETLSTSNTLLSLDAISEWTKPLLRSPVSDTECWALDPKISLTPVSDDRVTAAVVIVKPPSETQRCTPQRSFQVSSADGNQHSSFSHGASLTHIFDEILSADNTRNARQHSRTLSQSSSVNKSESSRILRPQAKYFGVKSPGVKSPGVKSPGAKSPGVKSSDVKSPGVKSSDVQSSRAKISLGVKSPGVKHPGVKSPGIKSPGVKSPGIKISGIKSHGVKSPGVKSPGVKSLGVKSIRSRQYLSPFERDQSSSIDDTGILQTDNEENKPLIMNRALKMKEHSTLQSFWNHDTDNGRLKSSNGVRPQTPGYHKSLKSPVVDTKSCESDRRSVPLGATPKSKSLRSLGLCQTLTAGDQTCSSGPDLKYTGVITPPECGTSFKQIRVPRFAESTPRRINSPSKASTHAHDKLSGQQYRKYLRKQSEYSHEKLNGASQSCLYNNECLSTDFTSTVLRSYADGPRTKPTTPSEMNKHGPRQGESTTPQGKKVKGIHFDRFTSPVSSNDDSPRKNSLKVKNTRRRNSLGFHPYEYSNRKQSPSLSSPLQALAIASPSLACDETIRWSTPGHKPKPRRRSIKSEIKSNKSSKSQKKLPFDAFEKCAASDTSDVTQDCRLGNCAKKFCFNCAMDCS